MRDAGRIDVVLAKICEIWKKYPDLRLMQLLINVFDPKTPFSEAYYTEEDDLMDMLDETYPRSEMNITSVFETEIAGLSPAGGANPLLDIDALHDLLLLVSYDVPEDIIKQWLPEKRALVEEWAAATHLEASDNILAVPNCPDCLDGYEDDDLHTS